MELFNKAVASLLPLVPKPIVKSVSSRYIAGATLDDAVTTVKRLNSAGAMATVDVLGEFITRLDEAEANTNYACDVLRRTSEEGLKSNLSIKLTSLGMGLDNQACERNVRRILNTARAHGNIFVRFDMENSPYTSITVDLYRKLRKEYTNIGVVLQAYLRRTENDIRMLLAEGNTNVRLCKGIYIESEEIAFKGKEEIRANFLKCLDILFQAGAYVGIATHDDPLIDGAKALVKKHRREISTYEFQMLLGVREHVRDKLIQEGYRLRIYVPFGADWYGYSIRRLKENPSIAGHIMKAFFRRS